MPTPDIYTAYQDGVARLLERMGAHHPHYAEGLAYQQRLVENVVLVTVFVNRKQAQLDHRKQPPPSSP